jgi:hypothetical protein
MKYVFIKLCFLVIFIICIVKIPKFTGFFIFGLHHPPQQTFNELQYNLPPVDIQGAFFINLETSKERKQKFLDNYNGPLPLIRVNGVRSKTGTILVKKGTLGCTLAHKNAIKEVANKKTGWWCVFEDDCVGDFNSIKDNIFVKNIVHRTNKSFINLSAHTHGETYSLSRVHFHANAYLVNAEKAIEIVNIIDKHKWKYVIDTIFSMALSSPTYYNNGNNMGSYVNLLEQDLQFKSDRILVDNR